MTLDRLIVVIVAFAVAVLLTPVVRRLAIHQGWLDRPNHRSSHATPKPRLGGVAFIAATIAGVAIGASRFEWWMLWVGAAALVLALTGLLDDLEPLGAVKKFLPQLAAAVVAVAVLNPEIRLDLPGIELVLSPILAVPLAIFWIVGMVNAFNFIDGLDGLASGVALVSALGVLALSTGAGTMVLLPFAAAMAGFLIWNRQPATIFMGDVGSQFVGYILAISVFMTGGVPVSPVPVLFVFAPVLMDAAVTIGRRLLAGRSPFKADRNHVFHGLVRTGLSHRLVTWVYAGLTALTVLGGVWYAHATPVTQGILLGLMIVVVAALAAWLAGVRYPIAELAQRHAAGVPARTASTRPVARG